MNDQIERDGIMELEYDLNGMLIVLRRILNILVLHKLNDEGQLVGLLSDGDMKFMIIIHQMYIFLFRVLIIGNYLIL